MTNLDEIELEKLARYAVRRLGRNWAEKDDQLQQARMAAYQGAQSCKPQKNKRMEWHYIFKYTQTYLVKHNKKELKWVNSEREMEEAGELGGQELEVLKKQVQTALLSLSDPLRQAVEALALGETWQVTAARLGISRTTLTNRRKEALERLRCALSADSE